jgi:hypothetical protein
MPVATLVFITCMVAYTGFSGTAAAQQNAAGPLYVVLSPWADIDPIPPVGISPRLDTIDGKTIGLFANSKRSAMPQVRMVEKRLKERFPNITTSIYHAPAPDYISKDSPEWGKFSAWIKSVDAVVLTTGD